MLLPPVGPVEQASATAVTAIAGASVGAAAAAAVVVPMLVGTSAAGTQVRPYLNVPPCVPSVRCANEVYLPSTYIIAQVHLGGKHSSA